MYLIGRQVLRGLHIGYQQQFPVAFWKPVQLHFREGQAFNLSHQRFQTRVRLFCQGLFLLLRKILFKIPHNQMLYHNVSSSLIIIVRISTGCREIQLIGQYQRFAYHTFFIDGNGAE